MFAVLSFKWVPWVKLNEWSCASAAQPLWFPFGCEPSVGKQSWEKSLGNIFSAAHHLLKLIGLSSNRLWLGLYQILPFQNATLLEYRIFVLKVSLFFSWGGRSEGLDWKKKKNKTLWIVLFHFLCPYFWSYLLPHSPVKVSDSNPDNCFCPFFPVFHIFLSLLGQIYCFSHSPFADLSM